jgi:hypothetical protein
MRSVNFAVKNLEGPYGIYASSIKTGMHWDKPYTWPIHRGMIVEGLNYYADLFKQRNQKGDPERSKLLKNFAGRISQKYIKEKFKIRLASLVFKLYDYFCKC